MVVYYSVFGRQVGSHVLAMITLGSMAAGSWYGLSGGGDKKAQTKPPINAGSSDEEKFIKDFLQTNSPAAKGAGKEPATH